MSKIIALGDTHGRDFWKQVVATETFDQLVFIGDYFDSYDFNGRRQLDNFLEICAYKRAHPDKVTLLIGNHDYHYMPVAAQYNQRYSGIQDGLYFEIRRVLEENKDILQLAYMWEAYLFTHAGVTNTWLCWTMGLEGDEELHMDNQTLVDYLNDLLTYTPQAFVFRKRKFSDHYGDDVGHGPLWVRPQYLLEDAYQKGHVQQVVGHTRVKTLSAAEGMYFIDCLGSTGEYFILEDGVFYVGSLVAKPKEE